MTLEDLFAVISGTLPPAPLLSRDANDIAQAIDHRRLDEIHPCAFCGRRARAALYWHPSDLFSPQPRWLDTCWTHHSQLLALVFTGWPDDAELVAKYTSWLEARR